MDTEDQSNISYDTTGVPTLYCNVANVTISLSDLRLYLAEMSPKTIAINPGSTVTPPMKSEAMVSPKLSIVMNPEFAKNVADAILVAIAKYEQVFGPLRATKTLEQLTAALEKK